MNVSYSLISSIIDIIEDMNDPDSGDIKAGEKRSAIEAFATSPAKGMLLRIERSKSG